MNVVSTKFRHTKGLSMDRHREFVILSPVEDGELRVTVRPMEGRRLKCKGSLVKRNFSARDRGDFVFH